MTEQNIIEMFSRLLKDMDAFQYLLEKRPLLAHYTSISVLEKIMKDEELWFSNPLFMNDLEEMRFGIHQGVLQFDQLKTEITRAAGSLERFQIIESAFIRYYQQFDNEHAIDVYAFCFAEHSPDDEDGVLSMWRAYGGNGNGAALIFNTSFLTEPKNDSPLLIAKVHYTSGADRTAWIKDKILAWCRILAENKIPTDQLYLAAHSIFNTIKIYALTSKHKGFCEENEWRLIYLSDHDHKGIMKDGFHYVVGKLGVEPKLKFKIRPLPLTAPEVWSFDSILDRIILGPSLSTGLARNSIVRMLHVNGKGSFASRVRSSSIPLRPV